MSTSEDSTQAVVETPDDRHAGSDAALGPDGTGPRLAVATATEPPAGIAIVGSPEWQARLLPVVSRLELTATTLDLEAALAREGRIATHAVLLAPPLSNAACWFERRGKSDTPVFLASIDEAPPAAVLSLYRRGAEAILPSPAEDRPLHQLIAELLALRALYGAPRGVNRALARLVTAQLKAHAPRVRKSKVRAKRGTIRVAGSVPSFVAKQAALSHVESLPGVRFVDVRNLVVHPQGISDATIRRDAEWALREALWIDPDTLCLKALNGRIKIAGTVRDQREMEEVVQALQTVPGIRDIENLVTIAPAQKRRDRALRSTLRRLLQRFFPERNLRVSVFGGTAVVDGRVPDRRARRRVSERLEAREDVRRVVNRVETEQPRLQVVPR